MSLWKNQAFVISHADNSPFKGAGLRAFFEYRDLGIADATKGCVWGPCYSRRAR